MPFVQYRYQFQQGSAGWSEEYYFSGDADPDKNLAHAKSLGVLRAAVLARTLTTTQPRIVSVSIRNMERNANGSTKRQVATFPLDYIPPSNATTGGSMGGTRALKISLFTAGKENRRMLLLRGAPVSGLKYDLSEQLRDASSLPETVSKPLDDFLGFTFYQPAVGAKPVPGSKPQLGYMHVPVYSDVPGGFQVTAFGEDQFDNYLVFTIPGHQLNLGDKIKIRGLRGPSTKGVNGNATVISVDRAAGTVKVNKFPCIDCGLLLTNLGRAKVLTKVDNYIEIKEGFFSGYADHRTGHAQGFKVGKSKACCKAS